MTMGRSSWSRSCPIRWISASSSTGGATNFAISKPMKSLSGQADVGEAANAAARVAAAVIPGGARVNFPAQIKPHSFRVFFSVSHKMPRRSPGADDQLPNVAALERSDNVADSDHASLCSSAAIPQCEP